MLRHNLLNLFLLLLALTAVACGSTTTTSSSEADAGLTSPILDFAEDDGTNGVILLATLRTCMSQDQECGADAAKIFCADPAYFAELAADEFEKIYNYFCDPEASPADDLGEASSEEVSTAGSAFSGDAR